MKIFRILQFLFLLVSISGCARGRSTPTLEPFTVNPIPVLNPVSSNFELVDCSTFNNQQFGQPNPPQDDVRNDENDAGNIQCGYLTVLEDRRIPDGPTIKIAVTIFLSSSPTRQSDPLILIGGGSSLGRGRFFGSAGMFDEMVPDRDIIMFDIRGMGRSQPAYNCPEYSELASRMASDNLSVVQWQDGYIDATQACRERLEGAGANLSAYTSVAVAADMEDLRQALGYNQWNVYASSYGTRIAFTLMRDFPQSLRSVVLDSPWPLQVDPFAEQALHAEQVLNTLFQYCTKDEQCNQYYPLLKDYFYDNIDTLNARPITVHTANLSSGVESDIVVDGNRLLDFVLSIISSSSTEPLWEIPRMIYQLHDGKSEVISQLLGQSTGYNRLSGGVEQLLQCNDEAGFSSLDAVITGSSKVDIRIQEYFKIIGEANLKACEMWNPINPSAGENKPVTSDISTLLLTGDLNWRIPTSWAGLAAQTLSHSYKVEFPGTGQALTSSRAWSACSNAIVKAFLTEPGVQPDIKCAAVEPHFVWITLP
jgi:pimeloyl-ACP methyl ester carboxylesterase